MLIFLLDFYHNQVIHSILLLLWYTGNERLKVNRVRQLSGAELCQAQQKLELFQFSFKLEQDSNRKCSALKDFSVSAPQNLKQQKNLVKQILGPTKFQTKKKITKNTLTKNNFNSKRILRPKIILSKKICSKNKFFTEKFFCLKNIFGQKIFFPSEKYFGPKKFLIGRWEEQQVIVATFLLQVDEII